MIFIYKVLLIFDFKNMKKIIILTGPTASGKSSLALEFAIKHKNIDIINADSMQVYSEIPIICANPPKQDLAAANHKLYGFLRANEPLSAGLWIDMIDEEIKESMGNNKTPLLVGGSTMYIRLLLDGIRKLPEVSDDIKKFAISEFNRLGKEEFFKNLCKIDPICYEKINKNDSQRAIRAFEIKTASGKSFYDKYETEKSILSEFDVKKIALIPDVETVYNSCNLRFLDMLKDGVLDEISDFLKSEYDENLSACKAIGVPEIKKYIQGEMNLEEVISKTQQHTRNYAKRQRTWINNRFDDFIKLKTKGLEQFERNI